MPFNATKFYIDYRIDFADRGNKHTRPGWVNTHCPFCHGKDYHLGFHISSGAFNCWKCGTKGQAEVVKALINCDWETAIEIVTEYTTDSNRNTHRNVKDATLKRRNTTCPYPTGTQPLNERARQYLLSGRRKADGTPAPPFEPELLEQVWDLQCTDHLGEYKFRIIAPIYLNGRMVSYQGRDYTGKSGLRYKACKKEDEVIDHQNIVYGLDQVKGRRCLVVEGLFDVWRLGPGAVSCFGTAFTLAQVNLLADRMDEVFILFDADDENAVKMAEQLGQLLSARGVAVEILELEEGDPAEMEQEEADNLMEELELEGYK